MGRPDSRGVVEPGREVGCSSILDTGPPAGLYRLNPRILRLSLLSYSATNNGLLCRPFFSGSSCLSCALPPLFLFCPLPPLYLLPSSSSLSISCPLPPLCLFCALPLFLLRVCSCYLPSPCLCYSLPGLLPSTSVVEPFHFGPATAAARAGLFYSQKCTSALRKGTD